MPLRRPIDLRARDQDRVHTCAALDRALADGQIDDDEHSVRIALATDAPSLADLHDLIDDLQGETDLAAMPAPRVATLPSPLLVVGTPILVLAVVVLSIVLGVRACGRADDPTTQYGAAGYLAPDAIADILAGIPARIGGTEVDSVTFYPEYVIVTRQNPSSPRTTISDQFRDGDWNDSFTGDRSSDDVAVDLSAWRADIVAGLIAGAPQTIGLDRIDTVYFSIRSASNGPRLYVNASNDNNEDGYFTADAAGNFLYVDRFDPSK